MTQIQSCHVNSPSTPPTYLYFERNSFTNHRWSEERSYAVRVRNRRQKEKVEKIKRMGNAVVIKRDCKTEKQEKSPLCSSLNSTGWLSAQGCRD